MFIHGQVMSVNQTDRGMVVQEIHCLSQGGGSQPVVTIDPSQIVPLRQSERRSQSSGQALMGSSDDLNAGILLSKLVSNGERVIGGAVVPENEFKVGIGLAADAVQSGGKVAIAVVNGNDERDEGWHDRNGLCLPVIQSAHTKEANQRSTSL